MFNLTEEDVAAWEARIKYEEDKLAEWGWKTSVRQVLDPNKSGNTYEETFWTSPKTGKEYTAVHGKNYDAAVSEKIDEQGWKHILELNRSGKLEWNKPVEKWARYQSPVTKRVYSFLEVQDILEQDWDEDKVFPDRICEHTRIVNELIGPDFTSDTIRFWFYLENGLHVSSLWEEKDGKVIETKTIKQNPPERRGNVVGWGLHGLEYGEIKLNG
jgi:hypothetical protein